MRGFGSVSRYNGRKKKLKNSIYIIIVACLLIGGICFGELMDKTDASGTERLNSENTAAGPTSDTSNN